MARVRRSSGPLFLAFAEVQADSQVTSCCVPCVCRVCVVPNEEDVGKGAPSVMSEHSTREPASLIKLAPGQVVSRSYDVSQSYDLTPGRYVLTVIYLRAYFPGRVVASDERTVRASRRLAP